jgi:hypothetical protein
MAIFIGVFSAGAPHYLSKTSRSLGIYSFLKFLVNTNSTSLNILILNTSAGILEQSMGG